jgi:hypothetical protein
MIKLRTARWDFMRILRVGMGVTALIIGIKNQDTLLGFAGGFLFIMGLANIGCCAANGCTSRSPYVDTKAKQAPVQYEEVH